jgi:hypothetical protein
MTSDTNTDTTQGLPPVPLLCFLAYIAYLLARAFYRLYLHPLSKFPGPKAAAVTSWYEGYYEILLKGQYSKQIAKLHDEYGRLRLAQQKTVLPFSPHGQIFLHVTAVGSLG